MADALRDLLSKTIQTAGPQPAPAAAPADPLKNFLSGFIERGKKNQEAIMGKMSPFQKNLATETTAIAGALGGAADTAVKENVANVRDAIVGKLNVTPSDVASGAYKTVRGIGKLAQGFNEGVIQLGSSLSKLLGGQAITYDKNSILRDITGQDSVETIQDFAQKAHDHAISIGATKQEAQTFGGAMALGLAFADNPFFGGEGKAAFNLSKEAIGDLVKAATDKQAAEILIREGVPKEIAEATAPIFRNADSPKLVKTAAQEIANGINNVKNGTGATERGFVTSVKERIPELETRVAGQYIPRDTDALATKAANLVKDDISKAIEVASKGTDDKAVATAVELIKKYSADAKAATDKAVADQAYDQAARIANDMAVKLTEGGRTIQAASILARQTPEGQLRFAAREIQRYNESVPPGKRIPELSGEQSKNIVEKFQKARDLPDASPEQAKAFAEAEDYVASLVPTPLFTKIVSVWKAGLLTGIKTSGLNIGSNLFHGISETVKDIPAAVVDSVASLFTGKRTTGFTLKGTDKGIKEGFQKGVDYLKTGFDERHAAKKMDMAKVNFGSSPVAKAIQAYEQSVFRVIGAEDMPFYYGAKARSIADQAWIEAKNEGLKGKELKARAAELSQDPTDEMIKNATLDAETAVFQNSTTLGNMARDLQRAGSKDGGTGAGTILIPFGRTPAAVTMQLFNYSPVGFVSEIAKQIRKGEFNQRLFSKAAGRAVTGTGALYLGMQLFNSGRISLGYPDTDSEREKWKIEGRQENSIKIGDTWRQVGALGPLGMSLIIGGYIANGIENSGSFWGGVAQGAFGALKTVTQQTFLQGLTSFLDALNDPEKNGLSYFSGLLASIVPTIVGDVARGTDQYERDTSAKTIGDLPNRLISRIPGARETLQPNVDVLGKRQETPDFFTVMLDPSRPTQASNDPVVKELVRLQEAGHKVVPTMSALGDRKGFGTLTKDQNTALKRRSGDILKGKLGNLFSNADYQKLSDDEKEKIIDKYVTYAHDHARAELVIHLTDGLTGKEYTNELARLKGNLLSKEVFRLYQKLR